MSSFPRHKENLETLEELGISMSSYKDSKGDFFESWNHDDLTYLVSELITVIIVERKKEKEK